MAGTAILRSFGRGLQPHGFESAVDIAEMDIEIEDRVEIGGLDSRANDRVRGDQVFEVATGFPTGEGMFLNQAIGGVAVEAPVGKEEKHLLGVH